MSVKIVQNKLQVEKNNYSGGVREMKTISYPHENAPLKPYSNILSWSRLNSDYGNLITDEPHVGFEILTYVMKGYFEVFDPLENKWVKLSAGNISLVNAGKGIRHSEKLAPRSEILQVWFDPDFKESKKREASINHYYSVLLPVNDQPINSWVINNENSPNVLQSKDTSVGITNFLAGFHTLNCPTDSVISAYVLDGYIEIDDVMLGQNDFFKVDQQKDVKIISLINSKLFFTTTPYEPEYQTYASMNGW